MWEVDEGLKNNYFAVCQEAAINNGVFSSFRSNPRYNQILEHVSQEMGARYFDIIQKESPHLCWFYKFITSESIGQPTVHRYGSFNISPTTLRYIKVLSDLVKIYPSLDGLHIAEIGGGYGGQCKIIHDVFTPASYTIFDDPKVIPLQERFLEKAKVNGCSHIYFNKPRENFDLVVSNYCLDELSGDLQNYYKEVVLNKCCVFYITAIKELSHLLEKPYEKLCQKHIADVGDHALYVK